LGIKVGYQRRPSGAVTSQRARSKSQLIHEGAPFGKAALLEEELDFGVAAALST
jgi:hypothetical protein